MGAVARPDPVVPCVTGAVKCQAQKTQQLAQKAAAAAASLPALLAASPAFALVSIACGCAGWRVRGSQCSSQRRGTAALLLLRAGSTAG